MPREESSAGQNKFCQAKPKDFLVGLKKLRFLENRAANLFDFRNCKKVREPSESKENLLCACFSSGLED